MPESLSYAAASLFFQNSTYIAVVFWRIYQCGAVSLRLSAACCAVIAPSMILVTPVFSLCQWRAVMNNVMSNAIARISMQHICSSAITDLHCAFALRLRTAPLDMPQVLGGICLS